MPPYRILSIDGGGIRGIIPAVVLGRIEAALPGFLAKTSLVAGTSTGGLIALGIAHGRSPAELADLYRTKGRRIFRDSILDDLRDLGRTVGADYDTGPLARAAGSLFGDVTLGELRKKVLIPAFDLDDEAADGKRRWKPKFFHNFRGTDSDGAMEARRVALYTTAAPTFFPSVDGYIDGGVVANNPSVAALAQTQDRRSEERCPRLDRVTLLSLGTGRSLLYVKGQRLDWGFAQWAKPLVRILFDGDLDIADYQCRQLLGPRYRRLDTTFPPGRAVALDDAAALPFLEEQAAAVDLAATLRWLKRHWFPAGTGRKAV